MAFTFFFRDQQTLEMIRDHAAPALRGRQHIRVWDAGCAHGPEPYSLLMVLREGLGPYAFRNLRLLATDLDQGGQFQASIAAGVFPDEQIRRLPARSRDAHFRRLAEDPARWRASEELRAAVTFQRHDLLSLQPPRRDFCLIVCKNVLLHFTADQRAAVLRMFHDALQEDGFLAMEQTQKPPADVADLFAAVVPHAQIYRKRAGAGACAA